VDYITNSHSVDGNEVVSMRLKTPSGIIMNVPLELEDGRYKGTVSIFLLSLYFFLLS
jgi:hypothetical protein